MRMEDQNKADGFKYGERPRYKNLSKTTEDPFEQWIRRQSKQTSYIESRRL
jgi:hypothetical protein